MIFFSHILLDTQRRDAHHARHWRNSARLSGGHPTRSRLRRLAAPTACISPACSKLHHQCWPFFFIVSATIIVKYCICAQYTFGDASSGTPPFNYGKGMKLLDDIMRRRPIFDHAGARVEPGTPIAMLGPGSEEEALHYTHYCVGWKVAQVGRFSKKNI